MNLSNITSNKSNESNQINILKILDSVDKKHQIKISIIDNIAWFNINKLDYQNYKTFLILLKDTMIILNSNGVKFIKQYIFAEDLKYFEKSSYLDIGNEEYVITTDIIHFLSDLMNVLGINRL